jgi:hypothetical protein
MNTLACGKQPGISREPARGTQQTHFPPQNNLKSLNPHSRYVYSDAQTQQTSSKQTTTSITNIKHSTASTQLAPCIKFRAQQRAHAPPSLSPPIRLCPPSTRPPPTKKHQHEPQTPGNAAGYPRHHIRTTDARSGNKTARNEAPTEAVKGQLLYLPNVSRAYFVLLV